MRCWYNQSFDKLVYWIIRCFDKLVYWMSLPSKERNYHAEVDLCIKQISLDFRSFVYTSYRRAKDKSLRNILATGQTIENALSMLTLNVQETNT